ncbi:MAG: phage regulatory CII family protein [Gammaproteobacteria bacterium]
MDCIDQAAYDLVHDHPGGAPKLAPKVGMNVGTLLNKANPSQEGHQFTVREALALQAARGVTTMIDAEAQVLGGVFIRLGRFETTSDTELLNLYTRYHAEVGETAQAIADALEDKVITEAEYRRIEREAFEDAHAMFELLARLRALVVARD